MSSWREAIWWLSGQTYFDGLLVKLNNLIEYCIDQREKLFMIYREMFVNDIASQVNY